MRSQVSRTNASRSAVSRSPAARTAPVPPHLHNLVAWFKPDFNTNGSQYDIHPEDREIRTVQQGRAITQNGVNGFLSIPQASNSFLDWDFTQPFTICFWLKTSNLSTQNIWTKFNTATSRGFIITTTGSSVSLKIANSNSGGNFINCGFSGIKANGGTITYSVTQGIWVHVALTYDGSGLVGGINCYLNGYVSARTPSANALSGTVANTISWQSSSNGGTILNGSLFDLRMYTEVKSQQEIQSICNGNLEERGLVVKLNLDEQSGTTFYNSYKTAAQIATFGQAVGNATHSNIVGLTHITQVLYSFQNKRGYNVSSGVFIPRNEAVTASDVDALGNVLVFYKPVRYRITVAAGVINFNPDSAPLSKYQSNALSITGTAFPTLLTVPTVYNKGDATFSWDELTNPFYVDRSKGVANETNFLIYRDELDWFRRGAVCNFINLDNVFVEEHGQSNSIGTSTNVALLTPPYSQVLQNVYYYDRTNVSGWSNQYVAAGSAVGSQFGPELSACYDFAAYTGRRCYLNKFAVGSTSLHNGGGAFWSANYGVNTPYDSGGNSLYLSMVIRAANAINLFQLSGRKIKVLILNFDQGEADVGSFSASYQADLKATVLQFPIDIARLTGYKGKFAWISRRLGNLQISLNAANVAVINQGMINLGDPNNVDYVPGFYSYSSDGSVVQADGLHFDGTGAQRNGQLLSATLIAAGVLD
jgi:hypothetical protein